MEEGVGGTVMWNHRSVLGMGGEMVPQVPSASNLVMEDKGHCLRGHRYTWETC